MGRRIPMESRCERTTRYWQPLRGLELTDQVDRIWVAQPFPGTLPIFLAALRSPRSKRLATERDRSSNGSSRLEEQLM